MEKTLKWPSYEHISIIWKFGDFSGSQFLMETGHILAYSDPFQDRFCTILYYMAQLLCLFGPELSKKVSSISDSKKRPHCCREQIQDVQICLACFQMINISYINAIWMDRTLKWPNNEQTCIILVILVILSFQSQFHLELIVLVCGPSNSFH